MPGDAYDPLEYENLANSVTGALMKKDVISLPPEHPFEGQGVYAIYYNGSLPFYSHISSNACEVPIYVGKAVPDGARKGRRIASDKPGKDLYRRLREHAKSIEEAKNLHIDDFRCRYLVVVNVWIVLAEGFLIRHYKPLWNTVVDGFGNHKPGKGRRDMRRPLWDILHPGRSWAMELKAALKEEDVVALIEQSRQ